MIEFVNVSKSYDSVTALENISLKVQAGEVLGVLGPNGAGKTTLIKLIAGFLSPDAGIVRPTGSQWPKIGYKPERLLYPGKMRVREFLALTARLSNVAPGRVGQTVASSLAQVGLTFAAGKRVNECSKGMRQRLGLAQALIGEPSLLLLDEPTNGLDPEGQDDIQARIGALRDAGKTVLLSSHQLHEITAVCTHLVILNKGRIHYHNSMAAALAERPHTTITVNASLLPLRQLLLSLHPDIEIGQETLVLNREAIRLRRQVLSILLAAGYDVTGVTQHHVTLAEIYAEAVQ